MKLKKYMVYLDDGHNFFKVAVPAEDEDKAKEVINDNNSNDKIIAIKEASQDYPISIKKVIDALKQADFDKVEIDLISRTLMRSDSIRRNNLYTD